MPPACFLNAPTSLPLMLLTNNAVSSIVAKISGSGARGKAIRHTKRNQPCSVNAWHKATNLKRKQRGRILKPQV